MTSPLTADDAELIERELARRISLADFVRESWPVLEPSTPLVWNWHIDAICDHVEALLTGWAEAVATGGVPDVNNLAVTVPPGSLKSRVVSVCAPAWMWLRNPAWRVICLSRNPRVALRDALFSRRLVESAWYQERFKPEWQLSDDQNAKGNYGNTAGGARQSAGIGAGVTGTRGDAVILDDPLDIKDRHSAVERETVKDAWDTAIRNRVNDPQRSCRIIIMQRVHPEDLVGHIFEKERAAWQHLNLPQEYDPDQHCALWTGWQDPRTTPGELLFPARFTPAVLAEERTILGSADYDAIHQQNPRPKEGALVKLAWLTNRWRELPPLARMWAVFDPTAAENPTDWAVLQLWGEGNGRRYLVDQVRGQWSPLGMEVACKDALMRWIAQFSMPIPVVIERSAAGPAVAERLRSVLPGVVTVVAKDSKEARLQSVAPQLESGSVWLPDPTMPGFAWVGVLVDELTGFPFAKHDDCVDALSHALLWGHQQRAQLRSISEAVVKAGRTQNRFAGLGVGARRMGVR